MKLTSQVPTILLFGVLCLALIGYLIVSRPSGILASATPGNPARIATSSNPTIGTSGVTLFATSSCTARIITTYASPIMLTFSDYAGQTPTATYGHLQPASTTVAYDSGQYGCGLYKAYGFVSTAITVSETR